MSLFYYVFLVSVLFFIFYSLFVCFLFKQKTAYEMRISDWSSDVCSSDLTSWLTAKPATKTVRVNCTCPTLVRSASAIDGIDGRYSPMHIWFSATMKVSSAIEPGLVARKVLGGMQGDRKSVV